VNKIINIDYDKLGTTADDIEQGNAYIDRLSLEEEKGRTKGGRKNVETSVILAGNRCTDRGRTQSTTQQEIIEAQEQLLKQYATDKNLWIREQDVAATSVRQLESGYESRVYLGMDNRVTKFVNLSTLRYIPSDFIDNRISLYNHLFPDTPYELIGFSEKDERVEFVLRQPFILGRHLDFNIEDDVQLLDAEMQKQGFHKLMQGEYENDCYGLYDLRNGNVIIDEDGNLFFIDVVTKLNTSLLLGGIRQYGCGEIVNIPKIGGRTQVTSEQT
jgi:hypothetical protein